MFRKCFFDDPFCRFMLNRYDERKNRKWLREMNLKVFDLEGKVIAG